MSSNVDRFSHWRMRNDFSINEAAALWIGKPPMEPWRDEFLDNEFSEEEKPIFLGIRELMAAAIAKGELSTRVEVKVRGASEISRPDYDLTFVSRNALAAWAVSKEENPAFLGKDIEKILLEAEAHDMTASYLNYDHPYYVDELAVAVRAWLALFENGKPMDTKKSFKQQVRIWLNADPKGRTLSCEARERIATLINPNKKGGAPSSEG